MTEYDLAERITRYALLIVIVAVALGYAINAHLIH